MSKYSEYPNEVWDNYNSSDPYWIYEEKIEKGETLYRITNPEDFMKRIKKDKKRLNDMIDVSYSHGAIDFNIWTKKELKYKQ